MNLFSAKELTANYAKLGSEKAEKPAHKLLLMGILAGLFIAAGAVTASTAAHTIASVSIARLVSGLIFAFGLGMVMLMGAELFTGNTLISISVLNKDTTLPKMLRNWLFVYLGNFVGAVLLAAGCAFFGQFNYSDGGLAVYTIKTAVAKCSMPFGNAFVLGVFCNILVCTGVLCSLSAKDTTGRIAGAYIPVAIFVICGFEHCVANMYYVPTGIFAMQVPEYAALAAQAGIAVDTLNWGNFLLHNLLPVTLGNIVGGVGLGVAMWACNLRGAKQPTTAEFHQDNTGTNHKFRRHTAKTA